MAFELRIDARTHQDVDEAVNRYMNKSVKTAQNPYKTIEEASTVLN